MPRTLPSLLVMLSLALSSPVAAEETSSFPRANSQQVQASVERAVGYLQAESADWLRTRRCAACHHVPLPLWALSEADKQGYAIDKKFVADTFESLLGSKEKLLASRIFPNPNEPPDPRPQGRGLNMGLPFLAVAAQSFRSLEPGQQQSLALVTEEIVDKQQPDGSWEFFAGLRRPPVNESQSTDAIWILFALAGATDGKAPDSQRQALEKATTWLTANKLPVVFQDKVLGLLWAKRTGKPEPELQTKIDELFALERPDGGWSQLAEWPSDAYATGQTLYALAVAGVAADRPEIQRGVDFLIATQKADGSWPMTSRSTPDGSPGGATLLTPINCAASSWATLGLVRTVPKQP